MVALLWRLVVLSLTLASERLVVHAGDDIFSCGGFIRSDHPVDFSKIVVKLYTAQKSLKYETDCAPNNGYYMIPVYNKGSYVIKVHPPPGWSIEPSEVPFVIDGETDQCSQGVDINFNFLGFSIAGKVTSLGSASGPVDFKLKLQNQDQSFVQTTETSVGGTYAFSGVPPGDYQIVSIDNQMCMGKKSVDVRVVDDKLIVGQNLEITGYTVQGSSLDDGKPIGGMDVLLFTADKALKISGCSVPSTAGLDLHPDVAKLYPVCSSKSGADGQFKFSCIPSGQFVATPVLRSGSVVFDVRPRTLNVAVGHGPVVLETPFEVKGFPVAGSVLWSGKRNGIFGAEVLVDGKFRTNTNEAGNFLLEQVKTGTYAIEVRKPGLTFLPVSVKLSPQNPTIAPVVVSEAELCGSVDIDRYPENVPKMPTRKLVISKVGGESGSVVSVTTDKDGGFCRSLAVGKYNVEPQILPAEKQAGLVLIPTSAEVVVGEKPTDLLLFTQFKAKVSGKVVCKEQCDGVKMTLEKLGEVLASSGVGANGAFEFANVLPDSYKLHIESNNACWKRNSLQVTVTSADVSGLVFQQSGFAMVVTSTHEAKMAYVHSVQKAIKGQLDVKVGRNEYCLPEPGVYELELDSCHQFQDSRFSVDVRSGEPLNLVASLHLVSGKIVLPESVKDIGLVIRTISDHNAIGEELERRGPLKPNNRPPNSTEPFVYPFTINAAPQTSLELEPSSELYLFSPEKLVIEVKGDCLLDAALFKGEKGLFLKGKIDPVITDVSVKISRKGELLFDAQTDKAGEYMVGPLRSFADLEFDASKVGYVLKPIKDKPGSFNAAKLSELVIKIKSTEGLLLAGVLVSVSGGNKFRSNNLTEESGSLIYVGLNPGDYFIRPILKEFSFEPPTQMVQVAEGTTVDVELVAKRVAFSCYGLVRTLNGQPVSSAIVEAMSAGCDNLQEEAVTGPDGGYRIRGLQPSCVYALKIKQDVSGGGAVVALRTVPPSYSIQVEEQDAHDKDLILLPDISSMEVTGVVYTDDEYLSTLKIVVAREDDPDTPLHSTALGLSYMFFLPSMDIDNKLYIARLETSLNPRLFEKFEFPHVTFRANISFQHFKFKFEPLKKHMEAELSRGTYIMFPITIIFLLMVHYRAKLIPIALDIQANGMDFFKHFVSHSRSSGALSGGSHPADHSSMFAASSDLPRGGSGGANSHYNHQGQSSLGGFSTNPPHFGSDGGDDSGGLFDEGVGGGGGGQYGGSKRKAKSRKT